MTQMNHTTHLGFFLLHRSKATQNAVKKSLCDYLRFITAVPDATDAELLVVQSSYLRKSSETIFSDLVAYLTQKKKNSPNTIRLKFHYIRAWLQHNNIHFTPGNDGTAHPDRDDSTEEQMNFSSNLIVYKTTIIIVDVVSSYAGGLISTQETTPSASFDVVLTTKSIELTAKALSENINSKDITLILSGPGGRRNVVPGNYETEVTPMATFKTYLSIRDGLTPTCLGTTPGKSMTFDIYIGDGRNYNVGTGSTSTFTLGTTQTVSNYHRNENRI